MVVTRLQHHQLFTQEVQRLSLIEMETSDTSTSSSHSTVYRPLFASNMEEQILHTLAKEQIKNLVKFGGTHREDVIKWLPDVQEIFDRTQLQPSNKYLAVQSYLIDSAAKWFRYNKSTILDWSTFKIELVKAYQPSLHQTLLKMKQRVQLPHESVMDYYHDKIYLCLQTDSNMSLSMIIHYLIKGLKQSLMARVIRRHPSTPADFLIIAQDEEKILFTLNVLSYTSINEPDHYPNEDIRMDHMVNIVKRPVNVNNQSFNRHHHQPPPQPLMNLPITPVVSSSRRSYSQHHPSSSTSRQCYACYGFGHIALYRPNQKNV